MNTSKLRSYYIKEMGQGWSKPSGAREGFRFIIELASFVKGGVLLDAGAGQKRFEPFFKDSIYITQEHQEGILLKGMEKIDYDLVSPLDKKIPLKDNCLDGILSNSVLEHIRYPEKFLAEAYRVLKAGGKIYISVPFTIPEHEIPHDFNRPTRYCLKSWLEDAGFAGINIKPASTCTYSLTSYLPQAFVYDLLQTNQNPVILLQSILKSKHGLLKVMFKIPIFVAASIGYLSLKAFTFLLNYLAYSKPYQDANMPCGWLAIASKQGEHLKTSIKTKELFLKKYQLPC